MRPTSTHPPIGRLLIGAVTLIVVGVAVYLSYIAENGLPFSSTYNINVEVANANELSKNSDVRIGGTRVGQILTITPERPTQAWPHAFARLGLVLNANLAPLPADTKYEIRLLSPLGAKYLELIPGHERRAGLPDGGTFPLNTNPSLSHEIPSVDLDVAISEFGPSTRNAFRQTIGGLGNGFAGRGQALNDATYATARWLPPLENLLRVVSAPSTHLGQLISGWAATFGALAKVAPSFGASFANGATTFGALATPAFGQTLDALAPTETTATNVLSQAQPVLSEASTVVNELEPAAALLPLATHRLGQIVTAATPVWSQVPELASNLESATSAAARLAQDPNSTRSFQLLGSTDLVTFGSSAIIGLGAILRAAATAQLACNTPAIWARNLSSVASQGDSTAPWLRVAGLSDDGHQLYQAKTIAPQLHNNPYPIMDGSQCQAGNEEFVDKQRIGPPPKTSTAADDTAPPPGVLERGRKAGLVP
jgi:ABC-type transporter Mla subunit MlaD